MGDYTRVLDSFSYHVEDLRCVDCLYYRKKSKTVLPCGEELCRYTGILVSAIVNGNIKRKRGHFKWDK